MKITPVIGSNEDWQLRRFLVITPVIGSNEDWQLRRFLVITPVISSNEDWKNIKGSAADSKTE